MHRSAPHPELADVRRQGLHNTGEAAGRDGMEPAISIRHATIEEAGRISDLLTALAPEFIVGDDAPDGRDHLLEHLDPGEMAQPLASDEYRFHVAEDGNVLVGVAALLGSGHLYYPFVASAHHRKGLARRQCSGPVRDVKGVRSQPMDRVERS